MRKKEVREALNKLPRPALSDHEGYGGVWGWRRHGTILVVRYLLFALLLSCASASESDPDPTYFTDAKPIIDAKCATCHHPDNQAVPFSLTTFEDVSAYRQAIAEAVEARNMPPWPPADGCNEYKHDRSLTPNQRATLLRWAEKGLKGSPANEGTPLAKVSTATLDRVDLSTTMREAYTPAPAPGTFDDHRCFLLDFPLAATSYITGLEIVPGALAVAHHVLAFAAEGAEELAHLEALDAADPAPGWNCYGGDGLKIEWTIGGWAPGFQAVELPEGTGRAVRPGMRIVLNMHYNTLFSQPVSDRTSVRFKFRKSAQEVLGLPVLDLGWLKPGGMPIRAGEKDAVFRYSYDPTAILFGLEFTVYSASIHMHQLGSKARVDVLRDDGTEQCLLNIEDWDFEWQGEYWFRTPIRLKRGDRLQIECHFDNSAENQAIVNGKLLPPQDIEWGAYAPDEMCAATLMATF